MSVISSNVNTNLAILGARSTQSAKAASSSPIKSSPTVTTTNSAKVSLSKAAAATAAPAPLTVADALKAFQAANPPSSFIAVDIKDSAANVKAAWTDLEAMADAKVITSLSLSDSKAQVLSFSRADVPGSLSDATNGDDTVQLLQKITSSFVLNLTDVPPADVAGLQPVSKTSSLTMVVSGSPDDVVTNLKALQTAAKGKTLTGITLTADANATSALVVSSSDLAANPDALALVKGAYTLKVTNVAAADASKVIAAADKLLKGGSSSNGTSTIDIKDTAANLVANLKILEPLSVAGRLGTITVSDGKALVMTVAQIAASADVLNEGFTAPTSIEATAVSISALSGLEKTIEANSSLTLSKVSVSDKASAIESQMDALEAAVVAGKTSASGHFAIANIAITDKGSVSLTQSKVVSDLDALSILSGPYTLNVTSITAAQALVITPPSKDATLSLAVTDTAANIAASIDKFAPQVSSKTITSIALSDVTSQALTLTPTQVAANAATLKLMQGDYKLAVTDVATADLATIGKTPKLYSITIKDTLANVLANMKTIGPLASAGKIAGVTFTDKTSPTLSISDAFTIATTLPNLKLPDGITYNIADTASSIITHARFDVADLLSGAGKISVTDLVPPNLTVADAKTLMGLTKIDPKTKYNVIDGGTAIATQAMVSGEKILSGAAAILINKNFTIAQAKAVTGLKALDKGTVYSINDTADAILTQSAIKGDAILSKANMINVVDTSANILAKLDQLEVLAKAGKIADISFTDTPTGAMDISQAKLLNDADAIGKIISQKTLPTLVIPPPKQPEPLGPTLPPMKTLTAWSAETTLGTIVDGSLQLRPYIRADRWGNMIADIVSPASSYNANGQNASSLYLMAQDALGNTSAPLKIADFNTSLGGPGTPRTGGLYLLKPNLYSDSYTPNMVDNQLAVWMEQQPDNTYTMKYLPYSFSPSLAAADTSVPALATTGSAVTMVTGIDPNVLYFNWASYSSSNKFLLEYETRNALTPSQKDIYVNTFTVNGTGNNVSLNTAGPIVSGANRGAKLLMTGVNADATTAIYTAPDMTTIFAREASQGGQAGIIFSDLNPATASLTGNDRFLGLGPSTANTKIYTLEFGVVSTDPAVSAQTISIAGMTTSTPAATPNDKPSYKFQVFKGDAKLTGTGGTSNLIPTDSLILNNPVKVMWNQANIGNNTTLFAFQDGNVVHAVQVGSDGKIIADDQFAIPAGSTFDRYRPLNSTKASTFEFFWREPVPGSTTGETVFKSRIYDARGNTPITVAGYSGNRFNPLAGGTGDDLIIGHDNDVLAGGPGNDDLTSVLGGKDVVSYLGKSTDYKITPDSTDPFKVIVKDLRNGSPDGIDTLTNISAIRFADKTISLIKTSAEKPLTQNFLGVNSGITYATGTNSKGFMAVTGLEPGNFAVRIISGNGKDLPSNAASLLDAIANANNTNAFISAIQSAKTAGANTNPPFAIDVIKNITTAIDLNADGNKDDGIKIPLDIDTKTSTSTMVNLSPKEVKVMPQSFALTLNNGFLAVPNGTAKIIGGQSGASGSNNGSWINNVQYNFSGSEPYSIRLNFQSKNGASPVPTSALKLAAKIVAASTPDEFTNALYELWGDSLQNATPYSAWFAAALANKIDVNGDSNPDFNLMMQLIFNAPSPGDNTIKFSLT